MSVSRRRFLKHGAFAAIACAAPSYALSGRRHDLDGPVDLGRDPVNHLNHLNVARSAFENLIGSAFKVTEKSGDASPVWLRLISVTDPPALAPVNTGLMSVAPPHFSSAPTTSGYILSFSAGGTSLPQETYIFENERLGKFPMFIVPAGPGQYTAIFNLLNAPVALGPADDHASPVHGNGPSGGVTAPAGNSGPASGASFGEATAPAGNAGAASGGASPISPSGRPAQEHLEPMLGDRVKTQMPE